MHFRKAHVSLFLLLTLVLAACGGTPTAGSPTTGAAPATGATAPAAAPTTGAAPVTGGQPVTVLSLWGGSEQEAFQKVLDGFTAKTGIPAQYEQARDFVPVLRTRLAGGNPPSMAIVPRPGVMVDLAKEGQLKSLADLGLTNETMQQNYGPAWIDLGTVDGKLYGLTVKANSKSTIWYKPASFKELGVEVPKTWQDLLAITEKYKAAGKTPWAVGGKDAWTLTDWFENLYVRVAGPAKYTELFSGKLPFNDQSVVDTLTEMNKIIANPDYVAGGVDGVLGTGFVDGIGRVFGTKADAEMYFEGGFVGGIALKDVNPTLKPGQDIAFFPFPQVKEEHGSALIGGGDLAVAFVDSPEVEALLQYMASKEAGEIWAATGAIVSPNKTVDLKVYPNDLAKAEAQQVADATTFRFDGSDLLPATLGDDWSAVLQGSIETPADVKTLLDEFETKAAAEFKR